MKLLHAIFITAILYIIASLAFVTPARADGDSFGAKAWTEIQTHSAGHFFDNITPATFYDFKEHVMMAGGTSEFYTYRHASLDAGIIKSIDASTDAVPASSVLPIVGIKLKVGEWLDSKPALHNLGVSMGLDQGLLKYATAGAWFARDFSIHEFRYGGYTGLQVKF